MSKTFLNIKIERTESGAAAGTIETGGTRIDQTVLLYQLLEVMAPQLDTELDRMLEVFFAYAKKKKETGETAPMVFLDRNEMRRQMGAES